MDLQGTMNETHAQYNIDEPDIPPKKHNKTAYTRTNNHKQPHNLSTTPSAQPRPPTHPNTPKDENKSNPSHRNTH